MRISGLQKLTLLDYPGKTACTVFTQGCNYRCPFCHNPALVVRNSADPVITLDELLSFLRTRTGILDGVCITGGEPLINPDIRGLIEQIRALGFLIKLDTNGSFPERLRSIVESGLIDKVAMDIKAAPDNYARAIGIDNYYVSPVLESVQYLMESGVDYEFRTTAVKGIHTEEDFRIIGEWLSGAQEYYIQSFRDSGDLVCGSGLSSFTADELQQFANIIGQFIPKVITRGI